MQANSAANSGVNILAQMLTGRLLQQELRQRAVLQTLNALYVINLSVKEDD